MPSLASSPWMRTQPQLWSSRPKRTTSSALIVGRPRPRCRRHARHFRRPASLCQRSSVAGVTRKACQRSRGRSRLRVARRALSAFRHRTRPWSWRSRARTWWRRTTSSTSLSASQRRDEATSDRTRHSPRYTREKATAHDDRMRRERPAQGPDRGSGALHLATLEVDEEQHVEAVDRDRVDVEEVTSEHACSLCSKEL